MIGGITVFIYETGNYSLNENMLTLNAQRKLYRRNRVDDWSNMKETRSFQSGFERNELILKMGNSITHLSQER